MKQLLNFFSKRFFSLSINNISLASIDCETTGLDPKKDQIISIGGVKIHNGVLKYGENFHVLIIPENDTVSDSIKIHGLMPDELKNGTNMEDALNKFMHWLGDIPVIGYNIDFDYKILNRQLKQSLNKKLTNQKIEFLNLFRQRYQNHQENSLIGNSLESIADILDTPLPERHSALGDALGIAMMCIALQKKFP